MGLRKLKIRKLYQGLIQRKPYPTKLVQLYGGRAKEKEGDAENIKKDGKLKNNKKNGEEEKINLWENFSTYLKFLKKYKLAIFFIAFISLILEAGNIVDKFLFKIIIDKGTELIEGAVLRSSFLQILLIVFIVYVGVSVISVISRWSMVGLLNRTVVKLIYDLKTKFFNHLVHLSYNFHTTHKTGSLISRMTRGARAIERMTDIIVFHISPLLLQIIIIGGSLLYFNWVSAVVVLVTAVTFVLYSLLLMNVQRKARTIENIVEDREKGNMGDVFTNIDSIKYFGKEGYIKSKYAKLAQQTKEAQLRAWDYWRWVDSGQALILSGGLFFLLLFPVLDFLDQEITLGTLVFIFTVYGNLVGPMFMFVYGARGFYESLVDFDALFEYDKTENEIKDKPGAKKFKIKRGEIEFKNVWFKYKRKQLFKNFNLKINKSQKVALVGYSGCGKSTLVKLLYRFYDVNSGEILIDGKNIKNFKQEFLRSELSIVPQECMLFDDTIYNNVAFSSPGASRADVMKAIELAQLTDVINNFPQRENTIVGERGVRLSGGEKQRVSLARAILADKKIIILDEATSSLDSKTESTIQEALAKLIENKTSIIIAHRLSTIMGADKIVVMERGRIVQIGSHVELVKERGVYQKLWNMQRGGYIKM